MSLTSLIARRRPAWILPRSLPRRPFVPFVPFGKKSRPKSSACSKKSPWPTSSARHRERMSRRIRFDVSGDSQNRAVLRTAAKQEAWTVNWRTAMPDLIPPHGGLKEPVNRTVPADEAVEFRHQAAALKRVPISDADLSSLYRMGDGGLSPLSGPMDKATFEQVLNDEVLVRQGKT